MKKPEKHVFICGSFRGNGESRGVCEKKDGHSLLAYVEGELSDRGMDGYMVSSCGCLKACGEGPILVRYPEGQWYGRLSEDKIDAILDAWAEDDDALALQMA
ncbi:MAG: (2Fe-2S) ferredoxin domain-containing protein [Deltaproteobacteria bacterium]|nr:(2Fe-2S) ferredoxin domain-containing protein [Deltaproteobacteria bacterium]